MQNNGAVDAIWQVLHVKPRCEKKMQEYLAALLLEHYLPLRCERKVYQRRKVVAEKPLFPGYVFARFAPNRRALVLKSQLVVRILPVSDQQRLAGEMAQIRLALEVNPCLSACAALARGERARILEGPLRGMEGIVSVCQGATRIMLMVETIGQGVAVEVDPEILERV